MYSATSTSGREDQGRSSRILPFIFVIIACLAAGVILGILTGGRFSHSAQPAAPPAVYVFLGYDTLGNPTRLESLWVLTLDGNGHAAYFGISPSTIISLDTGQPALLRDFLGEPAGAPARLYKVPQIPQPATAVEFDEQGLAAIINRSGGLSLDAKTMRGQEVVIMVSSSVNPLDALRLQARIVQSLFTAAGPCLSESTLAGLSPDHFVTNVPTEMLIASCLKRGPFMVNAVQVKIMDQVIPMELPDGSIGLFPTTT
jgi:hypothetical protein